MEIRRIKLGSKWSKRYIFRWSAWLLAMSATVCPGLPQKQEQASIQEKLSVQDSISVNVVRADDALVKAGEDFNCTVTLDKVPNFKGGLQYTIAGPNVPGFNSGINI